MIPRLLALALVLATAVARGWIDYADTVERTAPTFGKELAGFSLQVSTAQVEFEQETPEPITIRLKNSSDRTTLLPPPAAKGEERHYALHLVLAEKEGESSLFSGNLLAAGKDLISAGTIPPRAETAVISVPFDTLEVAPVDVFQNGIPAFDPKKPMSPAGTLAPQLFNVRAVLFSWVTGKRPDFAVGSNIWRLLLKPKSPARMTETEKREKLKRYLARMAEGAYGGIGVSSQLAAFGDPAVEPLIAMAERGGAGATRESRIWAIITLCGTGSPKAQEYIVKRLQDPVDFGDLAFLTWHSQGCRSQKVRDTLLALARDIVTDRELPWEKAHGRESRVHGLGCLKYIFQHFVAAGQALPDETAAGILKLEDPETVAFGVMAWRPSSAAKAVQILKPMFLRPDVVPNLKRPVLSRLGDALREQGFPPSDRAADVDAQWLQAGGWLLQHKHLNREEFVTFLRCQVLTVKAVPLQKDVLALLQREGGADFPVRTPQVTFPQDWVSTWQWALKSGGFSQELAVRFLCGQMRTTEELDPVVQRALLVELKNRLGAEFPLKSTDRIDLDEAWPTCGNWLIEKGYFKPPKKRAKPTPQERAVPLGESPKPAPDSK